MIPHAYLQNRKTQVPDPSPDQTDLSTATSLFFIMPWYNSLLQKAKLNRELKMVNGDPPFVLSIPDRFSRVPIVNFAKYSVRTPI